MPKSPLLALAAVTALALQPHATASDTLVATRGTAIETIVQTDLDATWDELINDLSGRAYEISAVVPNDRTIRVLFQSDTPSHYVDCGEITVTSRHDVFGDRNYSFLAANSVRYLVVDEQQDELIDVERRTSLNALANIRLSPTANGTLVEVDAQYALKFRTREFGNNIEPRDLDAVLSFDSETHASAQQDIREGATLKSVNIECRATGRLERQIVSVLGNPG